MAIPGDMIWDPTKYKVDTTVAATDWAERVARRWSGLLGMDEDVLKPVFATLSDSDLQNLLRPGYYPKLSGNATSGFTVAIMANGQFPNIINHNGKSHSPDGQLGLPEQNEFGGGDSSNKVIPITDPAV